VVDYLGWAATTVFVASYFCKEPAAMRRVQMAGAAMWIAYGALMHAAPVVVANLLVVSAAGVDRDACDEGAAGGRPGWPRSRARRERHTRLV
jgi:protein-S-isoprenylcysteine O-methyltransferase Ste14